MNTQIKQSDKETRSECVSFTTGYSLHNEIMAERKPIKLDDEKPTYGDPSDSSTWAIV